MRSILVAPAARILHVSRILHGTGTLTHYRGLRDDGMRGRRGRNSTYDLRHPDSQRGSRAHTTHPGALSQREKVNVASCSRTTKRGMVTTPYAYRDSLNHATRVSVASRKPISDVISLCSSVTAAEATSPMFSSASPVSQITSRPIRRAEATVTEAESLPRPGGDSAYSTRYPSAASEDS